MIHPMPHPASLGRYLLREPIGRGGMGAVFRAFDPVLGREVAVKLLTSMEGETAPHPTDLARFQREAQAAARLSHPNAIGVYDVGQADGVHFLAMELIEGVGLDRWIATSPPLDAVVRAIEKTARALHAAHLEGIVHRDVKPANILVDAKGEPHLGDFGLARTVDLAVGSRITLSGEILGTPAYMSPEQARAEGEEVGPRSDVFSLGGVLYLALAGKEAFAAQGIARTVERVLRDEPDPPSRLRPGLPRELDGVCLKALEKEPHRRYGSAAEMADDLARFLAGEPVHARPPTTWSRLARRLRRHRAAILVALLLVAAAIPVARGVLRSYEKVSTAREAGDRRTRAQDLLAAVPREHEVRGREALQGLLPALSAVIAADPAFGLPFLRRGIARQRLGDFEGALADFAEAARLDPTLAEASYRTGFLLLAREAEPGPWATKQAREAFAEAERAAPGSTYAQLGEAYLAILGESYGQALATLDRLAKARERHADVFLLRASLRSYMFQARGVRRWRVPDAWWDLEAAIADLDVANELDPINPWGRAARGMIRFDLGYLDGAREDLAESFDLSPLAEVASFAARVAYLAGDLAESRRWIDRAIALARNPGFRRFRAFLDFLEGKYAQGLVDVDIVVLGDPDDAETLALRGILRYAAGDKAGAEADMAVYRSADPHRLKRFAELDTELTKNRAIILALAGGMKDMDRILFLPPERKRSLRTLQRTLDGFPWFAKALEPLEEAVKNSPEWIGLMLAFSRLSEERPELEGAPEFMVKGMGMESDFLFGTEGRLLARMVEERTLLWRKRLEDAGQYLRRASVRYRRGQNVEALSDLEEATRLAPSDADALYGLATLRALAGRPDDALDALRLAVDAGWGHPEYTRKDPDFVSIAGRAEFTRLVGE